MPLREIFFARTEPFSGQKRPRLHGCVPPGRDLPPGAGTVVCIAARGICCKTDFEAVIQENPPSGSERDARRSRADFFRFFPLFPRDFRESVEQQSHIVFIK